jgi:hypothetical protein
MPPDYSPTVEEAIGFYAPEYTDRIRRVFTDCAEKGIPYDEEMQIISGKGRRVWIRTIGVAERDESGKDSEYYRWLPGYFLEKKDRARDIQA